MIRSLKNDNYLVMETEAQEFPGWMPYKGQLRQQAYILPPVQTASCTGTGIRFIIRSGIIISHAVYLSPKKKHVCFFKHASFFCMLFYILFYFVSFLLNCLKCLIQILDDIVDVLSTDGETDRVLLDALICKLLIV